MKNKPVIFNFIKTRKLLWVILACFSLTSCSVKEVVYDIFEVNISKPLNRTKTTNLCQNNVVKEIQQCSVEVLKKRLLPFVLDTQNLLFISISYSFSGSNEVKNNSPPFYILFQQLKLAMVV